MDELCSEQIKVDVGRRKYNVVVGPVAPEGLEANWIPTSGKRPLPAVRFYGPTEAFNTTAFKVPDFELVG